MLKQRWHIYFLIDIVFEVSAKGVCKCADVKGENGSAFVNHFAVVFVFFKPHLAS